MITFFGNAVMGIEFSLFAHPLQILDISLGFVAAYKLCQRQETHTTVFY